MSRIRFASPGSFMASNGVRDATSAHHHYKRRRLQGACDLCRKKKSNSSEMPNNECTNCTAYRLECTHKAPRQPSVKLKTRKEKGDIQALEKRLGKMEQLFHQLLPEADLEGSLLAAGSPSNAEGASHSASSPSAWSSPALVTGLPYPIPQMLSDYAENHALSDIEERFSEQEDLARIALTKHLSDLPIDVVGKNFFGDSSAFMLLQEADGVKREVTSRVAPNTPSWDVHSRKAECVSSDSNLLFEFPEKDQLDKLINLYFGRLNIYVPLLHQPSFERDMNSGLHLRDLGFAQVVLMVCALACRCIADPGDLLPSGTSGGFKYFHQVLLLRKKLLVETSLYDLQYYCLLNLFLTMSFPQAGWNLVGLALRFAQGLALHRYRGNNPTVRGELWKRCFWALIILDRLTSSFTGRLCGINDEDLDADLPLACDDEYWECADPEQSWKQPPGDPSKISAFNAYLRLCEILSFALRTLYSTKKSRSLTGLTGDQWEQYAVADLDSAMNEWKDSLPDHLRWNPDQENTTFLHQSAWLHTTFYYIQIQIHRPYIQKPSPLSFPSLAICTNAARACSHIVDAKGPGWLYPLPSIIFSTFVSGVVILLTMYGNMRAKSNTDTKTAMENAQRCINSLKAMGSKSHMAGSFADVLTGLATMQIRREKSPIIPLESNKRPRDTKEPSQEQVLTGAPTSTLRPHKSYSVLKSKSSLISMGGDQGTSNTFMSTSPPALSQTITHDLGSGSLLQTFEGDNGSLSKNSPVSSMEGWNFNQQVLASMTFNHTQQQNSSPSFVQQPLAHTSAFHGSESNDTDPEVTALWSQVPSSFDLEDWDQFMAHLNRDGV